MENKQEYKSLEYWNKRKDPNKYNHIMDYERKWISPFVNVKEIKRVLDFGCGIGRTFPLYQHKDVTGVDFSNIYKDRCDKRMKHIVHNVHENPLPFEDKSFDVGLMIKVTLHANSEEVRTIISEVGRVCNRVMLIAYDGDRNGLAPHVFCHEYNDIVQDLGFKIYHSELTEDNQRVLVYGN